MSVTVQTARWIVRNRIRDGVNYNAATPVPFNMVRLEDLSDQVPQIPTPLQTIFQCRFQDVPTQRYMNVNVVPGTLVAYIDGSWTPTVPIKDVDINGNFTLQFPPVRSVLITYAWQYLSDGDVDQYVDESRQLLREFQSVTTIPDGLIPALISYAAARALDGLGAVASRLATVKAGDSSVDWSALAKAFQMDAKAQYVRGDAERTSFYTQGPEAKDPTAIDVSAPTIQPYTPLR